MQNARNCTSWSAALRRIATIIPLSIAQCAVYGAIIATPLEAAQSGLLFGALAGLFLSPIPILTLSRADPLPGMLLIAAFTLPVVAICTLVSPVLALFFGIAMYCNAAAAAGTRRRPQTPDNRCASCDYPLTHLPGPNCPECGQPLPDAPAPTR